MTGKNDNVNYKPMFLLSAMFMGIVGSGFMAKEQATVQSVPNLRQQKENVNLLIEKPVSIEAGKEASVNKIITEVLSGKISSVATPVLVSKENLTSVYHVGDYEVTLQNFDLNSTREQEIFVSVRKAASVSLTKGEGMQLTAIHDETISSEMGIDVVNTFKLKVNVFDDVKPVIELAEEEVTITEGDDFDAEDYIIRAVDNIDGEIAFTTESDVDTEEPGTYTVTYRAKDKSGNEGSASVKVIVEEKEEPQVAAVSAYAAAQGNVASSINGNSVLSSAMAQLGVTQDCTSLVSNALAAQGIYFRGYPAAYLSLGTIISADQAQPGDILYYANGGIGSAHVAIYAGNGQAVHGGWFGNQTVIDSAYVGSGPVFIRVNK